MKKAFAMLLAALAVLGGGCSSIEPVTVTEEAETHAVTEEKVTEEAFCYPKVISPLTWEKIDAIPVANGNMTSDQLRQICVDFMRLQLSFEWTPDRDHDFNIETEMHNNKPMR
ncbi:MAG: hypothetical protein IJC26_06930, partial [Clostridia bacterium]|nr:hypothetical protein [Clostridia bacterium]